MVERERDHCCCCCFRQSLIYSLNHRTLSKGMFSPLSSVILHTFVLRALLAENIFIIVICYLKNKMSVREHVRTLTHTYTHSFTSHVETEREEHSARHHCCWACGVRDISQFLRFHHTHISLLYDSVGRNSRESGYLYVWLCS